MNQFSAAPSRRTNQWREVIAPICKVRFYEQPTPKGKRGFSEKRWPSTGTFCFLDECLIVKVFVDLNL
jgi:hypothetical protein